jgi:hypothetical protein
VGFGVYYWRANRWAANVPRLERNGPAVLDQENMWWASIGPVECDAGQSKIQGSRFSSFTARGGCGGKVHRQDR